ncbi:unnamed protein product [Lactuca virosa]|uniref:Uncharacterized protein n=1 Tax=Lactuca virosa TaxID=75947 RepID=A0AAU9LWM4_9ASTR|nr:unnamed protein product [Lactuca virosa]
MIDDVGSVVRCHLRLRQMVSSSSPPRPPSDDFRDINGYRIEEEASKNVSIVFSQCSHHYRLLCFCYRQLGLVVN